MMRKLISSTFIAGVVAFAQPGVAQDADTVIATVNGQDLTIGHMIVLFDSLPDQYKSLPDDVLFDGIKEQLIQQTVLAQTVNTMGKAIALRLDNEERSLKAGVAIDEIVNVRVTDEALQAMYNDRFASAAPAVEYNASHILVETEDEAKALIAELEGGVDFSVLAQEKSTGPSGPNGGQLGWFGEGAMVAPFEEAVKAMEVGAISPPVQTQFGWHVIKLNETRMLDVPTLDDVRDTLLEELRQQAVEQAIAEFSAAAEVSEVDLSEIDLAIFRDLSLVSE